MSFIFRYIATIFLFWVKLVMSSSLNNKNIFFTDVSSDIAEYIAAKKYIPKEKELPRVSLIKNIDNDTTYLLSKLSDEELLKLLNEQPQKNEFNLNDILRIAFNIRASQESRQNQDSLRSHAARTQNRNHVNIVGDSFKENKRFRTVTNNDETSSPYFKLNHKIVDNNDQNYMALQKLKSLLNVYQKPKSGENFDYDDNKKELLFDVLVGQLKSLCCKSSKTSATHKAQYKTVVDEYWPSLLKYKNNIPNRSYTPIEMKSNEYMFLILNDEIKSNGSDELLRVDPESLDGNSSVLLLGPVTTPLSDEQLKVVMNRISNELIKPEYLSLLQRLSDGANNNKVVLKNFVFGPGTRRYIKPHRCNHQSKLAKVYGGPKWLICTGYLNLNKPSIYD